MFKNTYNFVVILTLTFYYVNSYKCQQNSPCSCEYEDGRLIDLHKLSQEHFLTTTLGNLTYYFQACSDKKPPLPNVNITKNECTSTSVCLYNKTDNAAINLGTANDAKFSPVSNSENYNILYMFHNRTTIITLVCTDYPESILYAKQNDLTYNLLLFSASNCPISKSTGLSTGSVLVIILFVFTTVYLLGGATVLHFLRGAQGREMIPNIDFWRDLPSLVKDGAVFLQNGCKPIVSNSDSYDKI